MLIQANQLTKIYGSGDNALRALDGVTLSVERGAFEYPFAPAGRH